MLRSICVQNLHPAQWVLEQYLDFLEKSQRKHPALVYRGTGEYGISDRYSACSCPGHHGHVNTLIYRNNLLHSLPTAEGPQRIPRQFYKLFQIALGLTQSQ